MHYLLKLLLLSLLCQSHLKTDERIGTYTGALDGDTIQYINEGGEEKKGRLAYIDCPELKQRFGVNALYFTNDFLKKDNDTFIYKVLKKDYYGRDLIEVWKPGHCLNYEIISAGLAWVPCYIKRKDIIKLEEDARELRLGLWEDFNPIEPWNYRKISKVNHCNRKPTK